MDCKVPFYLVLTLVELPKLMDWEQKFHEFKYSRKRLKNRKTSLK